MDILSLVLVTVMIVSAIVVIGAVLVQQGKGAEMGAAFGSGSAGGVFGSAGSANFLSRMTSISFTIFIIATLGITYINKYGDASDGSALKAYQEKQKLEQKKAAEKDPLSLGTSPTTTPSGAATSPTSPSSPGLNVSIGGDQPITLTPKEGKSDKTAPSEKATTEKKPAVPQ